MWVHLGTVKDAVKNNLPTTISFKIFAREIEFDELDMEECIVV